MQWPAKGVLSTLIKNKAPNYIRLVLESHFVFVSSCNAGQGIREKGSDKVAT